MTVTQLEHRLAALERTVAEIETRLARTPDPKRPWWKETAGRFANDSDFDEIVALGRAYRQSLREVDEGDSEQRRNRGHSETLQ